MHTHKYGRKLNVWFKYSLLNESAWRNLSNLASVKVSELIYSKPRIPARPEYSTALSKFLYPIRYLQNYWITLKIYKVSCWISSCRNQKCPSRGCCKWHTSESECWPPHTNSALHWYFYLPLEFLSCRMIKIFMGSKIFSFYLKRECCIWNFSLVLKYETEAIFGQYTTFCKTWSVSLKVCAVVNDFRNFWSTSFATNLSKSPILSTSTKTLII